MGRRYNETGQVNDGPQRLATHHPLAAAPVIDVIASRSHIKGLLISGQPCARLRQVITGVTITNAANDYRYAWLHELEADVKRVTGWIAKREQGRAGRSVTE